ncbi:hypothetical protein B0H19DRAFT_613675 [Mycena capillaripes]|nr:hypothetical protein B0H19DRAFT_613675 [Mycena capillaripes]
MPNDADGNPLQLNLPPIPPPADILALTAPDAASKDDPSEQDGVVTKPAQSRPLMIYTRPQILHLQSSPLVKSPPDMPELKHWFGEHEPTLNKKDAEPTTPNSARERRFRRDADDGEATTRPTFRSTLSQPSQMGNFKHQSLRDRDRDRDGDKDRERNIRDKEGQDRLRDLSDKYDRDRLAAPGLRNKERDIAPHLAVGSTSLSAAARRAEGRDGVKKKVGEVNEDWRRGSHVTRQERYESSRANREDRERPRSRGRDSSRPRREVSTSRRDRDTDDKEPAGDRRDDHRKPTREDRRTREDHRRERDERRERDADRDADKDEVEDPRRWRDDGKRDERIAARREREKASQENGDASGDRRWTVVEDRDGRTKRNHRDRRAGATGEDGKDREDRRDREREKEPAWMDTYIPESPGILGGKGGEGELDGIQAWKKGLKDQKEKAAPAPAPKKEEERTASESIPEKPLDEIQIFRMLMKREEEKKQGDPPPPETGVASQDAPPGIRTKTSKGPQISQTTESTQVVVPDSTNNVPPLPNVPPVSASSSTLTQEANSLLSILGKAEPVTRPPLTNVPPAADVDKVLPPAGSRFFPKPIHQQNSTSNPEKVTISEPPPPPSAQFNPPPGSRLLAFGARPAGKSPGLPQPPNGLNQQNSPSQQSIPPNGDALPSDLPLNGPPKSETLRTGFSPFEDQSRMSFGFEEPRDQGAFAEPLRRGDRAPFSLPAEPGSYADPSVFDPSSNGYSTGKGSRLAKFFDSKGREAQANQIQTPVGFTSASPNSAQRHEGNFNPMDGLLSKLNSSAQIQRPNNMTPPSIGGVSFGQQAQNNLHLLQQQQQHNQPQHLHLNNRLDSLYESRLDDRNFVPDGMVPGLRSAPPPRNRDSGIYSDSLEDSLHFNPQRHPQQHHRGLDPMYNPIPSVFPQPGARNTGIPIQPQYRGAPSPISNPQQRLPPGLANLGGRPPLDGTQFMGMPGLPSAGLHSGLHPNGPPQQQQFNNFAVNGNLNYGSGLQPQMRAPPSQLQGNLQHHQLASLGHPNIDLRSANQAQLLGLGGGGIRGVGMGGFTPQQGPPAQMQQPLHALRQQEQQRQQQLHQQQLPPHMMPHHHIQVAHPHQQQGIGQPNNNSDLMALLLGGTAHHRD